MREVHALKPDAYLICNWCVICEIVRTICILDEKVGSQELHCIGMGMRGHVVTSVGLSVSECCLTLTIWGDLCARYRLMGDHSRAEALWRRVLKYI